VEAFVRLKQKGQVTLPASIRQKLTLNEGDLLRVTVDGRKVVLEPAVQTHAAAVPFDLRRLDVLIGAFPLGGNAAADAERYDE
jgi:AbrB family looped-hinge helix DNA binding protein